MQMSKTVSYESIYTYKEEKKVRIDDSLSLSLSLNAKPETGENRFPRGAASLGSEIILHYLSAHCLRETEPEEPPKRASERHYRVETQLLLSIAITSGSNTLPSLSSPAILPQALSFTAPSFLPSSLPHIPNQTRANQWHHYSSPDPGPYSPSPSASASPPSTQRMRSTDKNLFCVKPQAERLWLRFRRASGRIRGMRRCPFLRMGGRIHRRTGRLVRGVSLVCGIYF